MWISQHPGGEHRPGGVPVIQGVLRGFRLEQQRQNRAQLAAGFHNFWIFYRILYLSTDVITMTASERYEAGGGQPHRRGGDGHHQQGGQRDLYCAVLYYCTVLCCRWTTRPGRWTSPSSAPWCRTGTRTWTWRAATRRHFECSARMMTAASQQRR